MNIIDFQQLTPDRKVDYVALYGVYLLSKKLGNNSIHVYHLGDFFIEMWYDLRNKHLTGINIIQTVKVLDVYLDQIDISELQERIL